METGRREKSEEKTDRQERHEFFGLERSREVCTRKTGQSNALLGIFREYRNSPTETVIFDQQPTSHGRLHLQERWGWALQGLARRRQDGYKGWCSQVDTAGAKDIQLYTTNMIWRYVWSAAECGLHLNISDFVFVRNGRYLEERSLLVPASTLEQTHLEIQLCRNTR